MKRTLTYEITELNSGKTIEKFLKEQGFSSSNIADLKKMPNNAIIDDTWVHLNQKLALGQTLRINIDEATSSEKIPPTKIDLDIVYEDDDIIVVNKPAGMPIHPSLNHYEYSLANGLAYYYEVEKGVPFIFRCANRLDKNTSGLTVVSKHMVSANIISTAVKNREFHRTYLAIIQGSLPEKEGTIDAPIGRVDDSIITRCVDFTNGERAVTHYKVLEETNGLSLVKINLETGRTHQIRVHFTYLGYPLIGDDLYNPGQTLMARQALHSSTISFTHPITGASMHFESALPADMASALSGPQTTLN